LQLDFLPIAVRRVRQRIQRCQPAVEMADRFEVGGALGGMLAGLQPLIDRAVGLAGRGQMMGQELGLAFDDIYEMLLSTAVTRA
jgi:hypothetical protein